MIIGNKDLVYITLLKLRNETAGRRSGKKSQPSSVPFIAINKRLKD
jgi:hypothetical protein